MRTTRWTILLLATLARVPAAVAAETDVLAELEPYIGAWESVDGLARQEFAWGLDRRLVHARLYFREAAEWRLVSEGAYFRHPQDASLRGIAIGIDMPVIHFDIVAAPAESRLEWHNTAYTQDGEPVLSVEEWYQPQPDEFVYRVYRLEGEQRTPWLDGHWRRALEAVPTADARHAPDR